MIKVDLQLFGGRGGKFSPGGSKSHGDGVPKIPPLPELEGSEKQVAWAEDIRQTYVNGLNALRDSHYVDNKKSADVFEDSAKGNYEIGVEGVVEYLAKTKKPSALYDEWKSTSKEYADFKKKSNLMSKDERNAFLRNKKRQFRIDFIKSGVNVLKNNSASWWIEHRPK